jgi:pantoate--beta-alanine ligase
MQQIEEPESMQAVALGWRAQGFRIGFVPTMGYLHEGHASLMRLARPLCDKLVVSIYVNPTQFAPGEDFTTYPRSVERDRVICETEGVDVVFLPTNLYAPNHSVRVQELSLSKGLCGRSRPTHFDGVATIVVKLLNLVQPTVAVFGQKDAQQAQVIRKVVADLHMPVDIVLGPIHRDHDGLAMSSRNTYLSAYERSSALILSRSLEKADALFRAGERNAGMIRSLVLSEIDRVPEVRVDYVDIVDPDTLAAQETLGDVALLAIAAYVGRTRLIDNRVLRSE